MYLEEETKGCSELSARAVIECLLIASRNYYSNVKKTCKISHFSMISPAEKVVLKRSKEYLKEYFLEKNLIEELSSNMNEIKKELWISNACYSIIGITSEYGGQLTPEMIKEEIKFLLFLQ